MIHSLQFALIEIIESETFQRWRRSLNRDAALRINARLGRVALGNFGDVKPVRDGLSEFRIDYGPGYRVYFMRRGPMVIVLLAGGDKRTQDTDINRAIVIAKEWKE